MYKLILIPLLVLFGAINTIQLKLQNIQVVDQQKGTKFFHPFMQSLCMFVGQVLVGIVYLIQLKTSKKTILIFGSDKRPAPQWIVIAPAIMDLLATLLSYIALNMVDSSVWQISRGGNIVFTAILSRLFLKQTFGVSSIVGCCMAFLGITSVQVVAVIYSDSSASQDTNLQIIGIILLLASIIFNSCGLVMQKWIFNKYQMSPLKMVFLQGVYGLIVLLPLTIGFQYINCPWDKASQCVNVNGQLFLQNINQFWDSLSKNTFLLVLNIGLIISIGISVPIAVTLSKKISPVSRSLADVCRTVIIWLFGIVMTVTVGQTRQQYKLQSTSVVVNILKALGFITLIVGTMLYHDLLPCFKKQQSNEKDQVQDGSLLSVLYEPQGEEKAVK